MRNFYAVCSLAVVLCLIVCVSAKTTVSKTEAEGAVAEAKTTAIRVREKAETELKKANDLLDKVQLLKSEAAQALSQAEKAPKDNKDAVETAKNIKDSLGAFDTYYSDAKKMLDNAISSLTPFLSDAQKWEAKSNIEIPNDGSTTVYTEIQRKATNVKNEAEFLERRIIAELGVFDEVDTAANHMAGYVKDTKYESLHLSVIVAVHEIENMMKADDNIIAETQNKKNEVSRIVEKMQSLKKNVPSGLTTLIEELCNSANEALRNATEAVQKATIAKAEMPQHKQNAAEALTEIRTTQNVTKAQGEAQKAEASVNAIKEIVLLLQSALQTADNSVTNAKIAHEKMVEALANPPSEQHTQQSKGKEEGNLPVADGTDSQHEDATIQPKSKDSPDQSDNSGDKRKGTGNKDAQNVATTALTGGKAPAPGAENDSAMTVSVPLLVALIASAFLQ